MVGALSPYLRAHVTGSLIRRGQAQLFRPSIRACARSKRATASIPPVLIAIYGHETSYGTVTGSIDLLEALASLGYDGRRREFFETEFVAALKLIDQGVPRWRLKGSWAGATGYPQFMPSVALRLRADGDGDGYADIWAQRARRPRLDRQLSSRCRLEAERALGRSGAHASTLNRAAHRQPTDARRAARRSIAATAAG